MFSSSSSSSKPKFAFNLTINDLTNVPEINGSCYIELQIRDGTRRSFHTSNINNSNSGNGSSGKNSQNSNSTTTNATISNGIKSTPMTTSRTFLNKFDEFTSSLGSNTSKMISSTSKSSSSLLLSSSSSTTTVSGNISATTSKKKLHNFKCNFNYKLSCNLKFNIKKKGNIIANKYLLLKIFYINNESDQSTHHHHHPHPHPHHYHTQITELGKVDINLSEYLNFDEPITTKYLLNDSKVNSILGVTIGLNELPPTFDFHTQLQIQDSNSSISGGSSTNISNTNSMLSRQIATTTTTTTTTTNSKRNNFNVPQFERKHVFAGIGNVLGDNNNNNKNNNNSSSISTSNGGLGQFQNTGGSSGGIDYSRPSTPTEQQQQQKQLLIIGELGNNNNNNNNNNNGSRSRIKSDQNGWKNQNGNNNGNDITQTIAPSQQLQQAMMDPIISQLYCKILESSWDPELYSILNYSPEQCIDDIFNNPYNKFGCNLKLKQLYESKLNDELQELDYYNNNNNNGDNNNNNDSYRELNGLISEIKYRTDLKSWNINLNDLPRDTTTTNTTNTTTTNTNTTKNATTTPSTSTSTTS